jgi:hypothetical protein
MSIIRRTGGTIRGTGIIPIITLIILTILNTITAVKLIK